MPRSPRVVCCVGDNCIDRFGPPVSRELVGGNAVNVAVHAARLGLRSAYFGAVGDDREGRLVTAALEREHVDIGHVRVRPVPTALTLIDIDAAGERHIAHESFGACQGYRPDGADIGYIAGADHCHIGWLDDGGAFLRAMLSLTARPTLSRDVSINADPADLGVTGLDIAFASRSGSREAALALGRDLLARGARLAVVTRGAQGSLAIAAQDVAEAPAAPADVLDTTGAGDSFIAGFLRVWTDDGTLADALASGARTAAGVCGHLGGFSQ